MLFLAPVAPKLLPVPTRNDNSMTIRWKMEGDLNGVLLGYTIYWHKSDDVTTLRSDNISASSDSYVITNLCEYIWFHDVMYNSEQFDR